jgi:flagellar assembly protein FliH
MNFPETSRLIKAHSARHFGTESTFNYDDLRRQCDEYVAEARKQGERLLAEAENQAAEIRRLARQEGRSAGEAEGLVASRDLIEAQANELAARQTRENLRGTLPALAAVVTALQGEREAWLSAWESAAVRLSARIAEKIIRNELDKRPVLAGAVIREALQLAAGNPRIRVRMNPEDLNRLGDFSGEVVETLRQLGEGALVPDEGISCGGCVVETRQGVIDARLETQLERISQELLANE